MTNLKNFAARQFPGKRQSSVTRFLSIVAVLLTAMYAQAQPGPARIAAIGQKFQTLPSPLPAAVPLDTTVCTVYYLHTYPVDNFSDGFTAVADTVAVQIGRRISKTFSQNLHLWDRNLTCNETNRVAFRVDYVDYEVFYNHPRGAITTQHRVPYSRMLMNATQVVEYREPIPEIEWEITDRRDSVGGYQCLYARCRFRGRDWCVWYSPEIPLPYGPWKLCGLPGLILKAEDSSGDYKFELRRISNDAVPIELYDWHPVRMSDREWRKTERKMYDHPMDYFSKNGEIQVLNVKTHKQLEEEWRVRYNPIELE